MHKKNNNTIVYTPSHIANFFLDKLNHDIDNLKLNKLVYIAFGWSYTLLDNREIFHEAIQAWKFGPVIPSLYHEFKHFGARVIDRCSEIPEISFEDNDLKTIIPYINEDDKQLIDVLNQVDEKYRKRYTAIELVALTHAEGTPWEQAYNKENRYNSEISKEIIKKYYDSL